MNGLRPCRRDLAQCPEASRQCAPCPHRDGRSMIRCLGQVTTRTPTRLQQQLRVVRRARFREAIRWSFHFLLAVVSLVLSVALGGGLALWLSR